MAGWHPNTLHATPETGTMDLQLKLPDLPVPDLSESLEYLLVSAEPLLSEDELDNSRRLIEEFQISGTGEVLQNYLLEKSKRCALETEYPNCSWMESWWDKLAYLSGRDPLPVFVNIFGTIFNGTPHPRPLELMSEMLRGILDFKHELQSNRVTIDALGRNGSLPLCMFQFTRMFGFSRIPGEKIDSFVSHPRSRHICVCCGGHWFRVEVERPSGAALSPSEIRAQLEAVVQQAKALDQDASAINNIACLTALPRDDWATARSQLATVDVNTASLEALDSSIINIVLRLDVCPNPDPSDRSEIMQRMCHGDGAYLWADKSSTFTVFGNGMVGFNGEHFPADAPVPTRMIEDVMKFMKSNRETGLRPGLAVDVSLLPPPAALRWQIPEALDMSAVAASSRALCASVRVHTLDFRDFGKRYITSHRLGPDSFVQMALQLAFARDQADQAEYQPPADRPGPARVAVYESATTRTFRHGRTDVIRSLFSGSVAFVAAMMNPNASASDKPLSRMMLPKLRSI